MLKKKGNKKIEGKVKEFHNLFQKIKKESSKAIVGQEEIIEGILRAMICDGHVLVEGIPGIAKTLIIRTLGKVCGCNYSRVQFTADLLPTDITGLTTYNQAKKSFTVIKGPIFSNFVIADEVNRAPAKVQSALLEAMQEKQVTIGRNTHKLPIPFFVMATQNPIESSGVYKLPEAQIDRFLFKLNIVYPKMEEEHEILVKNITTEKFESYKLRQLMTPNKITEIQKLVKDIHVSKEVKGYIIKLVDATRNSEKYNIKKGRFVEWGGSPRASIGLFIAGKAEALLKGKTFVTPHHVKTVAHDILRHRLLLNYEGQAENVKTDEIITEILNKVPTP